MLRGTFIRAWEWFNTLDLILDPRLRRCPVCRHTWESPRSIRDQDGLCSDCYIDAMVLILSEEDEADAA